MTPTPSSDPADLAGPLRTADDLDPLLDRIADAQYVLLGEASHGTHEYYTWRAAITRRLVAERGFTAVVVEGDWPDCFAVNRWVRGIDGRDRTAQDVLGAFERWPTWMWANEEVAELITWMREHDDDRRPEQQVGFYGFDVYSLWDSMRAVVDYLDAYAPEAVDEARQAMRCFEPYREDPQGYAWATRMLPSSCQDEVVAMLSRMAAERVTEADGGPEQRLDVAQNAAVVDGAERYYRAMIRGGPDSWNLRDTHMVDTIDRLVAHRPGTRCVVWAHNTHVGDARATDMRDAGMVNVGQLMRERHADDGVVTVGFTGHRGSVIAGSSWGAPMEQMPVPEAREGTVEDLLHRRVGEDALFVFDGSDTGFVFADGGGRSASGGGPAASWPQQVLPHRAIGVVYHPERERWGNYVPTVLGSRYDAVLSIDATTALRPLGPEAPARDEELETYPSGL